MKKRLVYFGVLLLLIVILPAAAAPVAGIHDNGNCYVFDENGILIQAEKENIVATTSGVALLVCTAQLPGTATLPASTIIFDAESSGSCSTTVGLTTRWQEVINDSGQVSLICHNRYAELL